MDLIVGLGHVDLVCRDLRRSLDFYRAVFGPLGLQEPMVIEGERGEQIHYLRFPKLGSGSLGLRQALEKQEFELYAPGLHHAPSNRRGTSTWHTRPRLKPARRCCTPRATG